MLSTCEFQEQLIFRFQGCMDTTRCEELAAEVRASLADANQPVAFDLEQVDFVSSAFLGLCVFAQRQTGIHGFQIINVCPLVKRVFKIAGLDAMLA
jgi:anti-anti-sigma factor